MLKGSGKKTKKKTSKSFKTVKEGSKKVGGLGALKGRRRQEAAAEHQLAVEDR